MDREDILNKLKTIIDAQLACGENVIHEDETLEALGGDSLDALEIVIAVEEEFGLTVDDQVAEQIKVVAQLADLISHELA